VVGLGNPGSEYEDTRHNAGFRIVERLAAKHGIALARDKRVRGRFGRGRIDGLDVALLAPDTWMNHSGEAVAAALEAFPLDPASELLVVYDDLDLPFGRLRLRPAGGAGGHNGMTDVQEQLGRSDFGRLRFGIGRPPPGVDPVEYVLSSWDAEQSQGLAAALDAAAEAIELALLRGVPLAMNQVNAPRAEEPSP
jgi:PTH1 family peptidyl-tRNA hydrolase